MPRSSTTIKKGQRLPNRGRGAKTLALESIREEALLGLGEDSTKEEAEKAVLKFIGQAAFNPTKDTASISNVCLSVFTDRIWPKLKPSDAVFDFEYNPKASLKTRVKQVSDATCLGVLPANIGQTLLGILADEVEMIKVLDTEERLNKIEEFQRKTETKYKTKRVKKVEKV